MKVFATLAAATSAQLLQLQGTRDDGVQWSATRSNQMMQYQEAGQSIEAFQGEVLDHGKGMHTLCYTNGPANGQCKTEEIIYTAYNWDGTTLTARGQDALGTFTFDGGVQGDVTVITKAWIAGPGTGLVGTINLHALPDNSGLFFGDFDFVTNMGTTGEGRFASAFTGSVKTSFDDDSIADQ